MFHSKWWRQKANGQAAAAIQVRRTRCGNVGESKPAGTEIRRRRQTLILISAKVFRASGSEIFTSLFYQVDT